MNTPFRQLALSKQGLSSQPQFGSGLLGTRNAIEHLGYVQIDTLSVVERAHHHILWSRVPHYEPEHLNKLVADKHIFEYWFHAASYLPIHDYRFALPNMASIRNGENRYYKNIDKRIMQAILARVRSDGPLRLRDFDKVKKNKAEWWNMEPVKRACETLFMQGDLMVCQRNGMEKVYDLTERCLPEGINLTPPTLKEYATYLFETTLRAHGIFTLKQLLHLKTGKPIRNVMNDIIKERIEAGDIKVINNPALPNTYIASNILEHPLKTEAVLKILSPFDNVLIHRDRLSSVFEFDYTIECYVTASKREYGYFCLPILYQDKFVGRIDCKAHRADQRLQVISLHLENKPLDHDQFLPLLSQELQKFAHFNKCPNLDDRVINLNTN